MLLGMQQSKMNLQESSRNQRKDESMGNEGKQKSQKFLLAKDEEIRVNRFYSTNYFYLKI